MLKHSEVSVCAKLLDKSVALFPHLVLLYCVKTRDFDATLLADIILAFPHYTKFTFFVRCLAHLVHSRVGLSLVALAPTSTAASTGASRVRGPHGRPLARHATRPDRRIVTGAAELHRHST